MSCDGKSLLRDLRTVLLESATSDYMDDYASYNALYQAAVKFLSRTKINTTTQSITTTASTTTYNLNPDFMECAYMDETNRFYIKYTSGSSDNFIFERDIQNVTYDNNENTATTPDSFSIKDRSAMTRLSGTTTLVGAASNGECTLTDTTASFSTTAAAGDVVHNVTDGSSGYVVSVTSNTALVTALFDGTGNDWSLSDSYFIIPQGRFSLVLDPPPASTGDTITVYYVQRPAPVFSPYRFYNIPIGYKQALVFYAAWLYKMRGGEPNFGDRWYQYFDDVCREAKVQYNKARAKRSFRVNLDKSASPTRSYR